MKTRPIKELLTILRDYFYTRILDDPYCGGLCSVIHYLYHNDEITFDERDRLLNYLSDNKPRNAKIREKKFVGQCDHEGWNLGIHWWKPKAVKPRINWLNKQIDKVMNKTKKTKTLTVTLEDSLKETEVIEIPYKFTKNDIIRFLHIRYGHQGWLGYKVEKQIPIKQ
jgi:hypothetical protein